MEDGKIVLPLGSLTAKEVKDGKLRSEALSELSLSQRSMHA